jgi:hypothetical protein
MLSAQLLGILRAYWRLAGQRPISFPGGMKSTRLIRRCCTLRADCMGCETVLWRSSDWRRFARTGFPWPIEPSHDGMKSE